MTDQELKGMNYIDITWQHAWAYESWLKSEPGTQEERNAWTRFSKIHEELQERLKGKKK